MCCCAEVLDSNSLHQSGADRQLAGCIVVLGRIHCCVGFLNSDSKHQNGKSTKTHRRP